LPGMDGLEFTRRVKENEGTRDVPVVALTAFAMKGDEQRAMNAGCDGYITKPIDTRTLGERIRHHLNQRKDGASAPAPPPGRQGTAALGAGEMHALRRRFLREGRERAGQLLLDLDGAFDVATAGRAVHQWVGTGGLLGYHAISRMSREVEAVLMEKPLDNAQLRETLSRLASAFTHPQEEMGA
ncbi:MAG TPA: response regulator, partial [Candidatus Sulfopaludibacter sp.]|nr:response regulator [Candidatus Sulfopaludibacter sp.]